MRTSSKPSGRNAGLALVELVVALAVLSIGLLAFLLNTTQGFQSSRLLAEQDESTFAFEEVVETLRSNDFSDLYNDFNGARIPAENLVDAVGNPAVVQVNFLVDETSLPGELGFLDDLNGDGDRTDTDVSGSYLLLPARLDLTFVGSGGTQTRTLWVVFGER